MAEDRYVFLVEWFDSTADLLRQYNLIYYLKDAAIEMFDLKNRRTFLKRTQYPGIALKDLYIGSVLTVYSRQLKVADYADEFTKNSLEKQTGKGFILIKPTAYLSMGKIINMLEEEQFKIANMKMLRLNQREAEKLIGETKGKQGLIEQLSSDLSVGIQVTANDCVNRAQQFASSVNGKFGKSGSILYVSQSSSKATKDRQFFFRSSMKCPAYFTNCSCLIIKPHIIDEGFTGQIIDAVLKAGFQISAMEMFWLDAPASEEFFEVYKNVMLEYKQMIQQMTNGPCIVMQVRQNNAVAALRELCGPHDPEMARSLRPKSIRSTFGRDKGKNAVHCTDLSEDALIQVEYFFNIMQK